MRFRLLPLIIIALIIAAGCYSTGGPGEGRDGIDPEDGVRPPGGRRELSRKTSPKMSILPKPYKTPIVGESRKIDKRPGSREFVEVAGNSFQVGPPWLGHRVPAEDGLAASLVMLPVGLASESCQIYVTAPTRDAFVLMAEDAALAGVRLRVDSGYRSRSYQENIFIRRMSAGEDFYDIARWVAPPGYSEHMLGTTLDLSPSNWSFAGTAAERWLFENAARYFFVQTYPENSSTGFPFEPWHWKYVGKAAQSGGSLLSGGWRPPG